MHFTGSSPAKLLASSASGPDMKAVDALFDKYKGRKLFPQIAVTGI